MQQIKELINGGKNVIRIENHPKYINAPLASSHNGYAGTDSTTRSAVAENVRRENPQVMHVILKGAALSLTAQYSKSGNLMQWSAPLTEDVASLFVNTDGILKCYTLVINSDCTVQINKFVRKSEMAQWRHSLWQNIDEAYIEIVEA